MVFAHTNVGGHRNVGGHTFTLLTEPREERERGSVA